MNLTAHLKACHAEPVEAYKPSLKKLLRIMKLTMILLTAACITASASGFTQQVTIKVKNAPLTDVFKEIKKQTGYTFAYNESALKNAKKVTLDLQNAAINQALDLCFKDQQLTYEIIDKIVVVKEKTNINVSDASSFEGGQGDVPPPIDIHGRVVDEKGNAVAGVTVTVKGSNKRTATNDNGEFALKGVDNDAVLVFTSVNMETFEIKVAGRSNLEINLKTKVTALGGVNVQVQTGYQRISRERFVGSYQQLDSQAFHSRPGMGIIERLDGRVNSVFFQKKGSAENPAIMIRGLGTLGSSSGVNSAPTSTDPLIVVDNFPMPPAFKLENINPSDVESLTVLTDAAAASIWGTRAGNGVIVITTKRGKYNQRLQMNVSSNVTITPKPDLYYYDQVSSSQYIDMEQYLFSKGYYDAQLNNIGPNGSFPAVSPVVEILDQQSRGLLTTDQATAQINALRNIDTRQQLDQYYYRPATTQQYYLSANGGTNLLAYQFSGGYNKTLNQIQGSKPDEQFTFNTNTTFKPLKNLEIVTGINLGFSKTQSSNGANIPNYPYTALVDDEGHSLPVINGNLRMAYIDTVGGGNLLDWHYRPLDEIRNTDNVSNSRFIALRVGLNYQLTPWLKAGVQYQQQNTFTQTRTFYSLQSYYTRDLINKYTNFSQPVSSSLRYPIPMGGILDGGSGLFKDYNLRGSLNFTKSFGANHQVNAMIAGDISDNKGGFSGGTRVYGYDPVLGTSAGNLNYLTTYPTFYAPNKGNNYLIPYTSGYIDGDVNRVVSLSTNASYTYKNRYTVYASARRDGSNVFGVETRNKWKPLWSAGGSWEVSKEGFYHIAAVPYLKLRASYGYTGNANNKLSGVLTFSAYPTPDPITGLLFSFPGYAANSHLKWEEVVISNLAVDFGLLKDKRLTGSFEVYRKKSQDLISLAPNPVSTGVESYVGNFADLLNTGYEISLNSRNIEGPISWTSGFGWSHSKTTIENLYLSIPRGFKVVDYSGYGLNAYPGQVIFGLASYKWAGLDPLSGDPQGYYQGQVSKDYSSIGNDSIKNQVFHGSALPLSMAFLRNTLSWKGFSLSFNLTGRFQYYFREPVVDISNPANLSPDFYKRWQKPGDESFTTIPAIYYPVSGAVNSRAGFYSYAEIFVKRGDNIRLQDANLSWSWMNKTSKAIPFQSATVFAYLSNINWIIWRMEDSKWDPDFIQGGTAGQIAPPPSKTWTLGVTLNF